MVKFYRSVAIVEEIVVEMPSSDEPDEFSSVWRFSF